MQLIAQDQVDAVCCILIKNSVKTIVYLDLGCASGQITERIAKIVEAKKFMVLT